MNLDVHIDWRGETSLVGGALRFRVKAEGAFLAVAKKLLPPVVRLSALFQAADAISQRD